MGVPEKTIPTCAVFYEITPGLRDGTTKATGKLQRCATDPPRKRKPVDGEQLVAARRDESRFEPLPGSQHQYCRARIALADAVRDSEKRIDVPGRATTREQVGGHSRTG
jgi:hypothetical protein